LKDTHPTNHIRLVEWTVENIVQLERVNKKFTCIVDIWLNSITTGFVAKFTVDRINSYTVTKQDFLRGPRGRYFSSLYTLIKISLPDKGMMTMESYN